MKGTLVFKLPEETEAFQLAQNGGKYQLVLHELSDDLRAKLKYANLTDEQHKIYTEIRERLFALLDEYNVPL